MSEPDFLGATAPAVSGAMAAALTRRQKAAVIVRLALSSGEGLPLSELPEAQQAELTRVMAEMSAVDRETLHAVAREFAAEVERIGLSFPGGLDGALDTLEGHISPSAAAALRRQAMASGAGDPWPRIAGMGTEKLLETLQVESTEVGAVLLSKLSVTRAADLLGQLPGPRARRLVQAIAETNRIRPENVRRIGLALLQQFEAEPEAAFDTSPVERVGAILNYSPSATREDVLEGLEQEDADFAAEVRKAIFTFKDIPRRIDPRDIPKILKECESSAVVTAFAAALAGDEGAAAAADYLLSNMSQRMAGQLREEIADRGKVRPGDGDAAMGQVVAAIRALESRGEIVMRSNDG